MRALLKEGDCVVARHRDRAVMRSATVFAHRFRDCAQSVGPNHLPVAESDLRMLAARGSTGAGRGGW